MKYNCITLRETMHSDLGFKIQVEHDDTEREEVETAPAGYFYFFPQEKPLTKALEEFKEYQIRMYEDEVNRLSDRHAMILASIDEKLDSL